MGLISSWESHFSSGQTVRYKKKSLKKPWFILGLIAFTH